MIVRGLDLPVSSYRALILVSLRHVVSELTKNEECFSSPATTMDRVPAIRQEGTSDQDLLYHLPVTAAVMSGNTTNKPSDAAGAISFVHRMIITLV